MENKQLSLSEEKNISKTKPKTITPKTETLNFPKLLKLALKKELSLEIVKELVSLKNAEEERRAKKDFDFHFAEMQKEFTPAKKSKKGDNWKYAEIADLEMQFRPIITKNGFSYHWTQEYIERKEKEYKRVRIIITGWGYTDDRTYFDVPEIKSTGQQNEIQLEGIKTTYGHRYTFKAGFGITEIGEDTDGTLAYEDALNYANEINLIRSSSNIKDLQDAFKILYPKFENDRIGKEILIREKNKRKGELNEMAK